MKKLSLLFSFILMLSFFVKAESDLNAKVVLCDSYDDYGIPTGINKNWDIKKEGGYVYILYSQDKNINKELSLYVDKKNSSGTYIAFNTKFFTYDPAKEKKKWAVYDYEFTEEGDYRITVTASGTKELATTYTNISFIEESTNEANKKKESLKTGEDKVDTYYFEDAKIIFGESVDDKAVVTGEATEFKLKNGKKEIIAKLQQDKDLKVTQVRVDLYGGTDYKDKISSEKYDVASKTWNWIKVPLSFDKAGKYAVDMYNEDAVFIKSAFLVIK